MGTAAKKQSFEHSSELKRLYNEQFALWSRKNRTGLNELAERCGVSAQYLAHIGRYGRIPGKPILTLLAFNFELADPQLLFRAAGIRDPWPYESGIGLRQRGAAESEFLSLHLDMQGFSKAIREIVRSEVKPRSLDELLAGRPLRVGLNRGQSFFFQAGDNSSLEGFFPEFVRLVVLALHVRVEFSDLPHNRFSEALQRGEIDLYGPIYYTAPRIGEALYTNPFCRVRIGALYRKHVSAALPQLPSPKRVSDLRKRDYRIAVHKDSMSHHFAEGDLGVPPERLILCDTAEESIERLLMSNIPRPAHLLLTDAPHAFAIQACHREGLELLFPDDALDAAPYEDTVAVRSDWPAVVAILNEVIDFLGRNGSLDRLKQRTIDEDLSPGILLKRD